jgi:hypothetical protein
VTDAFAVVHRVREGGRGVEKCRGAKVGGEKGGEAQQCILSDAGCGKGGIDIFVEGVIVDVRIGGKRSGIGLGVFLDGSRPGHGTISAGDTVLELGRGLEIWLLYGGSGSGRGGLIDGKCELHAFDRSRTTVDVGLAGTFPLYGTLSDDVRRVVTLETGCFQLFDAPNELGGKK